MTSLDLFSTTLRPRRGIPELYWAQYKKQGGQFLLDPRKAKEIFPSTLTSVGHSQRPPSPPVTSCDVSLRNSTALSVTE
eukprot:3069830-Rhodomonas_salina.3